MLEDISQNPIPSNTADVAHRKQLKVNTDFDYRASVERLTPAYKKIMMTHEFCRSVYLVMLLDFPLDWIVEFWSQNPLHLPDKNLEGADLLRFLWKRSGQVPVYWDCGIANALEPFFVSKEVFEMNFTLRLLYRNNSGTYIPGKRILSWFYPVMNAAFNVFDARDMVFKLCTVFAERVWTSHLQRRIKKTESNGWVHSHVAYIPDKNYESYVEFNFDYIAGAQFKASPRVLGLEPFEKLSYLCDIRAVETVLWTGRTEIIGDEIFIDGERHGRKTTFNEHLRTHALDLEKFAPPDPEVILIEKDYFCPLRKRVVLYSGCIYGGPVYITLVQHIKRPEKDKNYLAGLVDDAASDEEDLFEKELEPRHNELLKRLEAKALFIYQASDQSISFNGKHFLKSIPAKILAKILYAYTNDGKNEFEYRDFKKDFDISYGQKNSNFEIRFYRLLEKLEQEKTGLRIEKKGRGSFSIYADIKIEYRVVE